MTLFLFAVKQGIPTNEELETLGTEIAKNWESLGRQLSINEPKLQEIEDDYHRPCDRGHYMLMHWKQREGLTATYQALCDALQDELVQRQDLAERFCYIRGNYLFRERRLPYERHKDAHRLA